MPGLMPGINVLKAQVLKPEADQDMDGRDESGHDRDRVRIPTCVENQISITAVTGT
jgi:hypothetical protein